MRLKVRYVLDRTLALLALLVLAPLLVLLALAVLGSSRGGVIYRQRRVGEGGREFEMLKFRSMRPDARPVVVMPPPGLAPGGVEGADRRTPVGRFMRRTSLD